MRYRVIDGTNTVVREFRDEKAAEAFKFSHGNSPNWRIVEYMLHSTERQQNAVIYCMNYRMPQFHGNIEDKDDCHAYLDKYLNKAKEAEEEEAEWIYDEAGTCDPYDCC